jgi:putative PIN family toxin of toxin-antitoxin system
MLAALDTNIFFSALISPRGTCAGIYDAWQEQRFKLVTCLEQLEEIRRVSRYPKMRALVEPHLVATMLNTMRRAEVFTIRERRNHARDAADAYLLDLAEGAGTDYLVTGDKSAGLLERRKIGRAAIITAAAFASVLKLG